MSTPRVQLTLHACQGFTWHQHGHSHAALLPPTLSASPLRPAWQQWTCRGQEAFCGTVMSAAMGRAALMLEVLLRLGACRAAEQGNGTCCPAKRASWGGGCRNSPGWGWPAAALLLAAVFDLLSCVCPRCRSLSMSMGSTAPQI